ncbi:MAG: hypothetical protein V2A70_04315 [Candidatus Omnitrophota bacterium]
MKFSRQVLIWCVAAGIFLFGLVQGFSVAVRKPLWTDEIYSQISSVEGKDLLTMWRGGIREGNNAPLFYTIQKVICQATGFKGGDLWHKHDLTSMIVLRVAPVIFMSLALAFIFWFFARTGSLVMGAAALFMAMATYLVWAYWAEARPYAMLYALTALQAVVLMQALCSRDLSRGWRSAACVHIILAFTSPLSVIQVGASALVLWLAGYRKFVPLMLTVVVPLALGFWYHFSYTEHYSFWFTPYGQPLALVKSALPESRLIFLMAAPLILWTGVKRSGKNVDPGIWLFLGWVWLTILGYGVFLTYLWLKQKPHVGFEVSNRYMMALAPIGVVAVMFLFMELYKRAASIWARGFLWLIMAILVLPRLVKVFRWASFLN